MFRRLKIAGFADLLLANQTREIMYRYNLPTAKENSIRKMLTSVKGKTTANFNQSHALTDDEDFETIYDEKLQTHDRAQTTKTAIMNFMIAT